MSSSVFRTWIEKNKRFAGAHANLKSDINTRLLGWNQLEEPRQNLKRDSAGV